MDETHYSPSTILEEVVNELFIEYWSSNDSFGDYYSQCAPLSCTHKVNERNRPLYILTTLLGLYGGLIVALRFGAFLSSISGASVKLKLLLVSAVLANTRVAYCFVIV